jgi:hypothetical protein
LDLFWTFLIDSHKSIFRPLGLLPNETIGQLFVDVIRIRQQRNEIKVERTIFDVAHDRLKLARTPLLTGDTPSKQYS